MSDTERRKDAPKRPTKMFECRVCLSDIGVATMGVVQAWSPAYLNTKTGKVDRKMSRSSQVCAYCLGRGKLTEAI